MLHCATAMMHTPPHRLRWPVRTALLLALGAAGCSGERDPNAPRPSAADPGEQVFAMACARCHAADGAGDGELAGRLGPIPPLKSPRVAAMTPAELTGLIRAGRGAMPPHDKRLTPAQIDAVAAHVRRLNTP